jgi:hypothetical protein
MLSVTIQQPLTYRERLSSGLSRPPPERSPCLRPVVTRETDEMISLRTKRCYGRWLLGLFLIAQVAGVVPLVTVHLQHVIAVEQDIVADIAGAGIPDHALHHAHQGAGHEDGVADPNDQCCTLHHHLMGVLPHAAGSDRNGRPIATIVSLPPRAFIPANPGLLERPPKLPSSI